MKAQITRTTQREESVKALNRVLTKDAKHTGAWELLALIFADMQKYDMAVQCIEKAIRLEPRTEKFIIDKGEIQARMGKTDDAVKTLKQALVLNDKNANTWLTIGNLLALQKNYDLAAKSFNTAAMLDPKMEQAKQMEKQALELAEKAKGKN
jgi:tetratricopeptide (TPR) repeat protein